MRDRIGEELSDNWLSLKDAQSKIHSLTEQLRLAEDLIKEQTLQNCACSVWFRDNFMKCHTCKAKSYFTRKGEGVNKTTNQQGEMK
jgi:hypothetical protein